MSTSATNRRSEEWQSAEERDQDQLQHVSNTNNAVEDDGTPVMDEIDLEENDITEEEADNIEWDDER